MLDDTGRTLLGDAGSGDPIDALRAIKAARHDLDLAEAVAVRRARNNNASWQLIALARVTASAHGYPAPGHTEAMRLLGV